MADEDGGPDVRPAPTEPLDADAPPEPREARPLPVPSAGDEPEEPTPLQQLVEESEGPRRRTLVIELAPGTLVAVAAGLTAAALLLALLDAAPATITRVAIGVLVALALDPVAHAIQRRFECGRAVAVGVLAVVLAGLFAFVALVLGPRAVDEAQQFGDDLPQTVENMYDLPLIGPPLRDADAAEQVDEWLRDLPARIDTDAIGGLADSILGGALAAATVLVVTFAVLIDGERLVRRLHLAVPPSHRGAADRVGQVFARTVGRYFAGSLLVAVLNGLVITSAALALGVPLAPVAGIWSTITNLIPQIGGFLGGAFFVLLALTESPVTALVALAIFLVYQQIENNVIQPAIVGRAVNLSPPTTMLAALIGAAAAGVPGALAATPLLGTAKAIYLEIRFGHRIDEQPTGPRLPGLLRRRRRAPGGDDHHDGTPPGAGPQGSGPGPSTLPST